MALWHRNQTSKQSNLQHFMDSLDHALCYKVFRYRYGNRKQHTRSSALVSTSPADNKITRTLQPTIRDQITVERDSNPGACDKWTSTRKRGAARATEICQDIFLTGCLAFKYKDAFTMSSSWLEEGSFQPGGG